MLGAWPAERGVLAAKVSASLVRAGAGVKGSSSLLGGPQGPVSGRWQSVILLVLSAMTERPTRKKGQRMVSAEIH